MRRLALLLVLLGGLFVGAPDRTGGQPDPATELTYMTEEYRPLNYSEDGRLTGLAVDLLKLMWREMGVPEQPIRLYPWPRAYKMALTEPKTVIFATYRTRGREPEFKWVGPIAEGGTGVYALRSRHLVARAIGDLAGYRLAAVRDAASASILTEAGLSFVGAARPDNPIGMLKLGRVDAVAMDEYQFRYFVHLLGYDMDDFEMILPLCKVPLYYAFSRDTPDELIARFQAALDALGQTPVLRNLKNYYIN